MSALDSQIRQLLRRHSLRSITFSITDRGALAQAIPDNFHPKVEARRRARYLEAGDSITLQQAEKILAQTVREPVATFTAPEIELALQGLKKELQKP